MGMHYVDGKAFLSSFARFQMILLNVTNYIIEIFHLHTFHPADIAAHTNIDYLGTTHISNLPKFTIKIMQVRA